MPPKRKAKTDTTPSATTKAPKRVKQAAIPKAKIASKATKITTPKASPKFTIKRCEKWYEKYKDDEDPDGNITPEGAQQFFQDIDVSLESVYPILIGWKMNAGRMGYFTKKEWMDTMTNLQVDSAERLIAHLPSWMKCLENDQEFKSMYLYTFDFSKTIGQKSMDVDLALALWGILFGDKYKHIPKFIEFIQETRPVKVINKDQWSSLIDFVVTVPYDLEGYDSTTSWPVLFDEYADWRSKQAVE